VHAVVFDIDGTLLQSAAVDDALYREAVRRVLGEVTLRPTLHDYDFITDAGILSQILADNALQVERDTLHDIKAHFVNALRRHIDNNGPFIEVPGASDLLRSLRESATHAAAIATGGWRESAELKLQSAGVDYSDFPLATANDHHERTGIMEIALSQLGTEFESVTYYGDGSWDRDACAALDWRFIPVGSELGGIDSYIGHRLASHSLRPMLVSDMEAIFQVRTSVVDNHMNDDELREIGITREGVAEQLEAGELEGWCAVAGEDVVGFSIATDATREINALFVLPDTAGLGIGRDLLDAAVQHLRDRARGAVRLRTDPKSPAYAFYRRRGWRDTGEGREEDGPDGDRFLELE
jgi:GNAT superfamily N-acetyltransferase/phosphoglycolate phosphatase-like HAD superfamily hydrolase